MSVSPLSAAEGLASKIFGFSSLKPFQKTVIEQVLGGRDCLAIMPTGSGKSLCYVIPALMGSGITLVVSPLIALIRDQVQKFSSLGIKAAALDSLQESDQKAEVWNQIAAGQIKVLFVSPERLSRPSFRAKLSEQEVSLVAIDEAHCISQWGFHFRPEYRRIGEYLDDFPKVPRLALTATATPRIKADIMQFLKLRNPHILMDELQRENLIIRVSRASSLAEQMTLTLNAVLNERGRGIVYAPTRKRAEELQRVLLDAGVTVGLYHGGLGAKLRQDAQEEFLKDRIQVMVATQAFGMGIDKADIRFVHHAGIPSSLENYIQQIGRAGRDGKKATCWLIYGPKDYHTHKFMIEKGYPDLYQMSAIWHAVKECLNVPFEVSENQLLRQLRGKVKLSDPEIKSGLDVLYREGFIRRFVMASSADASFQDIAISLASMQMDEALYWREYPERRQELLEKLRAMKEYVHASNQRSEFIGRYFQGMSSNER